MNLLSLVLDLKQKNPVVPAIKFITLPYETDKRRKAASEQLTLANMNKMPQSNAPLSVHHKPDLGAEVPDLY